jgi:hypothetical protein
MVCCAEADAARFIETIPAIHDTDRMNRDITRDEEPWPSYALPRGVAVNGYVIERVLGSGGFGIT